MGVWRQILAVGLIWLGASSASASTTDCEALAEVAAAETGVPEGLLSAIARMESGYAASGGERRAWPWTINLAGDGSYHPNRDAALARARTALGEGRSNVDLGCMQLNYRWHKDGFGSLEAMIDPRNNTRYAARFLKDLYERHGSWAEAVAHYHSSDPERGAWYLSKVRDIRGEIDPSTRVSRVADAESAPRVDVTPQRGFLAAVSRPLFGGSGEAAPPRGAEAFAERMARLPEGNAPDLSRAQTRIGRRY